MHIGNVECNSVMMKNDEVSVCINGKVMDFRLKLISYLGLDGTVNQL